MTRLNEDVVKKLPLPASGNKVHYFAGAVLQGKEVPAGFGVHVTANGSRSFILNYRSKHVERRVTIGGYPTWSVLKAVKEARLLRQRIDRGEDPLADKRKEEAAKRDTFANIMDEFFTRDGNKLRSAKPRRQMLERLVIPELGGRDIGSIKRSEIIRLLDQRRAYVRPAEPATSSGAPHIARLGKASRVSLAISLFPTIPNCFAGPELWRDHDLAPYHIRDSHSGTL